MKRKKPNLIYNLCKTIADQNGLIFEIGGDFAEGYFIKFGIPSNASYEVQYVEYDPILGNDKDILMVLPKIYKVVRNLITARADIVADGIKDFADKKD